MIGSGVVTAATLRVTQATDDPGVASLSVVDDWDEANRAAVNLIAGQVAVAGGSGVNGATVLRATIATDDEINDDIDAVRVSAQLLDDAAIAPGAAMGAAVITIGARDPSGNALAPQVSSERRWLSHPSQQSVWTSSGGVESAITVTFATVTSSAELVALDGANKIIPLRIVLSADTASTYQLESNGGATAEGPPLAFAANSGFDSGPFQELAETAVGENLFLTVGTAQTAGGVWLWYTKRP